MTNYLKSINRFKKIKIRARKVKDGYSLYLDSTAGNRSRLTLDIKIKNLNDPLLKYAIAVRDKKELELIQDKNNFKLYENQIKFTDYWKKCCHSGNNKNSVLNYVKAFYIGTKNIGEISSTDCQEFANFLQKKLEATTAKLYFTIFRSVFNKAVRDQLIRVNPAENITIRATAPKKEYLTPEELQRLIQTPCRNEEVKRAFIFSCFTGLRFSDLQKVKRSDINNNLLILRQKKTKEYVTIPLHEKVRQMLDMEAREQLFLLPTLKTCLIVLGEWIEKAKIKKHITFHCGRTTFGTMLITHGADIYTVKKLLGHSNIQSTERYVNLVDQKRIDAIKMLLI